jgi:ribosome-binding protein aMBF1 (putative translation factor)
MIAFCLVSQFILNWDIRNWDVPLSPALMADDMDKSISSREQRALLLLLREHRRKAGLRQSDIAAKLRRHQSFVSKYEAGERQLDVLELRQVCLALGTTLIDFVRQLEKRL